MKRKGDESEREYKDYDIDSFKEKGRQVIPKDLNPKDTSASGMYFVNPADRQQTTPLILH